MFIFNSSCIIIALYVSLINIMLYIRNEDSSAFQIKRYDTESSSQYPDVSICFWAHPKKLFDTNRLPLNISSRQMSWILMAKHDMIAKRWPKHNSQPSPDDVLQHMASTGKKLEYYLSDQPREILDTSFVKSMRRFNKHLTFDRRPKYPNATYSASEDQVFTTWISAKTPCVTWKIPYNPREVLHTQTTYLRVYRMNAFERMYVFLHPPNQLIRKTEGAKSLQAAYSKTADFILHNPGKYDKDKKMIDLYLTNTKVIKKRSKLKDLCDADLHDEDGKWLYKATNALGCVPTIWSNKQVVLDTIHNQTLCRSYDAYRKLRRFTFQTKKITRRYTPPCKFMTFSTYSKTSERLDSQLYNLSAILDDQKLYMLRVIYKKDYYEEISNEKRFNEYDLFSQLGGIVGIMLGFSFLQLPELVGKALILFELVLQNPNCQYFNV